MFVQAAARSGEPEPGTVEREAQAVRRRAVRVVLVMAKKV
jgi:hypothetical protein